MSNYLALFSE